jgi:hypothetical protein
MERQSRGSAARPLAAPTCISLDVLATIAACSQLATHADQFEQGVIA